MPSSRALALTALLPLLTAVGAGQDSRYGVRVGVGQSLLTLGSEDLRDGFLVGLTYSMPHPRLRFRDHKGELTFEGYYSFSRSRGASGVPTHISQEVGLLAVARYLGRSRNGVAGYLELGWGLHHADRRSVDLNSRLSSSPVAGIGVALRTPTGHRAFVGLRLMHISNAGLSGDNQGQNRLYLTAEYKF